MTKSYSDLQSVMAIAGSSLKVAVANVSGSFFKVSVGFSNWFEGHESSSKTSATRKVGQA